MENKIFYIAKIAYLSDETNRHETTYGLYASSSHESVMAEIVSDFGEDVLYITIIPISNKGGCGLMIPDSLAYSLTHIDLDKL